MATIQFNCPACGHHYKVPASAAGRKAKCKACGAPMKVPTPGSEPDDGIELLDDEPGSGPSPTRAASGSVEKRERPAEPDKRESADLSSLYAADAEETVDATGSAAGESFDFSAASGQGSRPRSASRSRPAKKQGGLPMPLLIGAGGGAALLLILVIVLVVVVAGGGEDEPESPGLTAGTINNSNTAASRNSSDREPEKPFRIAGPDNDGPSAEAEQDEPIDGPIEEPEEVLPEFIDLPDDDSGLTDWTIRVDPAVAEAARQLPRAGVVVTAPPSWTDRSKPVEADGPQLSDQVAHSPDETIEISVIVGKYGTNRPPKWPRMMTMERAPEGYSDDDLLFGKSEAFRGPNRFMLVPDRVAEPVTFGTLFGGYRFMRFVMQGQRADNREARVIHYLGTIGGLYLHIMITGEQADEAAMAEAEWIARSARLMTESGLTAFARKTPLFQDWLRSSGLKVPRVDDLPPVASSTPSVWPGFADGSDFKSMMMMAGSAGPVRSPYRIAPPSGLVHAASSRLAVRWQPNEHGLWMAMEVVDLGSRWRRVESPLLGDDLAMISGREQGLPPGTQTKQMQINGLTVFRVLPPDSPAMDVREVFYVSLDHGMLVTVRGRYAKDRPDDLARLDAAVQTLGKR
ncbi:MAG: hypothetical protein AAGC44_00020 [Planctomycetota bacterium]